MNKERRTRIEQVKKTIFDAAIELRNLELEEMKSFNVVPKQLRRTKLNAGIRTSAKQISKIATSVEKVASNFGEWKY